MKANNNFRVFISLGITLLNLVATSAFAESGEGRNGPDQSGISIPHRLDRKLELPELYRASLRCTPSFGANLIGQILRQQVALNEISLTPADENEFLGYSFPSTPGFESMDFIVNNANLAGFNVQNGHGKVMSLSVYMRLYIESGSTSMKTSIQKSRHVWRRTYQVSDEIFAALDRLSGPYDSKIAGSPYKNKVLTGGIEIKTQVKTDAVYDVTGSIVSSRSFVSDFEIAESPIVNIKTGAVTNLTGNAEEFSACVQNNLAN